MILSTRAMLSRRRLFFVVVLLCGLVGACAGLHASGHDDSASAGGLAGIGCAIAVLLASSTGMAGLTRPRAVMRSLASHEDPSRRGVAPPTAPGLATLCRLRI